MTESVFNLVEGFWWIGLGIWLLYRKLTPTRLGRVLSVFLIGFGLTDFIEIFTGAWWRPWWLLALKSVCLTAVIILLIVICKERRRL